MSLSQAFSTSMSGLRTAQAGLSLVAANVANAETPGYVRKTQVQASSATGSGVYVASVIREMDAYLQRQMRIEASGGSYASLRSEFYTRLQSIYGTPGSETTIETSFNNFTNALQSLSTSPDDPAARSKVINAAQVLTQQLASTTASIQSLRGEAEIGISDAAQRANVAMSKIASLNLQIASSPVQDARLAALMDQRDAYVDELSQLMDIRVINGNSNQVSIFTTSGVQLVGNEAAQFAFSPQGTVTANSIWKADQSTSTLGTLMLVAPNGVQVDLLATGAIRSGEIAAYVEMRDHVLVEAQAQLDAFAAAMASALSNEKIAGSAVTSGAQEGFDIDTAGLLDGNSINLSYTDAAGQQRRVTIVRVDDPAALPLSNDFTADAGDTVIGVNFSGGLAAVSDALNAHFNGAISFSNPSGQTLRILDDGHANNAMITSVTANVTRTGLSDGGTPLAFFLDGSKPFTGAVSAYGSQSVGLAGRLSVNSALVADPSKLVVYQSGTNAADATRPNFILNQLRDASTTFSASTGIGSSATPFSGTLSSFLRQVISMQGSAAENAANLASGQEVVLNSMKARMADQSAVNVDVEMANLLNLQNAYGANARVMSVVKEMFDVLMRM